jgi:hypothetical protein
MNRFFFRCHACGFVHEAESVRSNLHVGGRAIDDILTSRRSGVLGSWLARRRIIRALVRDLLGV